MRKGNMKENKEGNVKKKSKNDDIIIFQTTFFLLEKKRRIPARLRISILTYYFC